MAELGAGIDELQLDVFQGQTLGVDQQGLSQGQDPLLGSDATLTLNVRFFFSFFGNYT